jgi:hypothetical protein
MLARWILFSDTLCLLGDSGEGEKGILLGPGEREKSDCRISEFFEGDRDKERRISRIAE